MKIHRPLIGPGRLLSAALALALCAALLLPLTSPPAVPLAPTALPMTPGEGVVAEVGHDELAVADLALAEDAAPALASPRTAPLEQALISALTVMGRADPARTGSFVGPAVQPPLGVRWSVTMPDGVFAAPAIAGETVYAAAADGTLYALDHAYGGVRWSYRADDWVLASPAFAAGSLFLGSRSGALVALDARTGAERWQGRLDGELYASPAVTGDLVYTASGAGTVYALDIATGAVRWQAAAGSPVYAPPAIAGGTVYVAGSAGAILALDAADGTERWRTEAGTTIVTAPAVADDTLYIGGYDGAMRALDASTGAELWRYAAGAPVSAPAVADGRIIVADEGSVVTALDANTGTELWRRQLDGRIYSTDILAPSVAGGVAYVGGEATGEGATHGFLHALDTTTGALLARLPTTGAVRTAPAIHAGVVYFGDAMGTLYAVQHERESPLNAGPH